MNIETEIRSFITKEQFTTLLAFFRENAEFVKEDNQETFYFDCPEDVRIQRNDFFSKVWLKKGAQHDAHREEIEIKFDRNDFKKLEKLFEGLGLNVGIKWYRKRYEFMWGDCLVCLDSTRGYGEIIELEKMCTEDEKEEVYVELMQKFDMLHIPMTPREVFEGKYQYYKENWKHLV